MTLPANDPALAPEPHYSCGHKRLSGRVTCELCDRCRCAPRRRRPLRRYFGRWLDLNCGKLMEAR